MRIVAIVNPISGAGMDADASARRVAMIRDVLRRRGFEASIRVTERAGHARELAEGAVEDRADLVIVWGGDGTVNEAGAGLVGSPVALGLIPAGSGNGLAAALGVPRDPHAALSAALDGRVRSVDVGTLNGRAFFNVAGIGFDAHVARLFNQRARGRRGRLPYVFIGITEGCRYAGLTYTVRFTGDSPGCASAHKALLIAFANGSEYGMGMRIAPAARPDDGLLEACIVADRPVLSRFLHARHFAFGSIDSAPGLLRRSVRGATVEAPGEIVYHLDGEPGAAEGRVEIAIRPASLRVKA